MAMVLDAFASYLQGMLTEMAAEEVHMLLGVSVEIDKMSDKLKDLKNFLADADRRKITDKSVQGWVTELRRAMYDATDILDLCRIKAMERGESTADAGCCNPFLFCIRNPVHAHDIGSRIKKLNERLNSIKQRGDDFSFTNLGSYVDHRSNVNPRRETSGELDRSGVVGDKIEQDTRELVANIMQTGEGDNRIMVVAIVGVGGIGKTTLAQKVFNNDSIQREFSKKIWLSINQNFSEVELLRTAIVEAGGAQPPGSAKTTLERTLKDALADHKTLMVMDDVWSKEAWEGVLKTPLLNAAAPGSRVLITTRSDQVAREIKSVQPYHQVDKLEDEDAWSLLKKQVVSSESDEDDINKLKDIGLEIIKKCGGLPLAVKAMGGLLCKREMLPHDWKQVLDDSKWSMTEMPKDLNNAVYLSYEDMPPYLKQCFLYYSLLPKSRQFSVFEVVSMWISEGFIYENSNDLEGLGTQYYKELICRNLIEPDKDNNSHYVEKWYCSMHDVVRSFAHYMVRDEAIAAENGEIDVATGLINSRKVLRLSIESNRLQSGKLDLKSLGEQQSMRTLISTIQNKVKPGDSLVAFSRLRTLHIESEDVAALLKSLHQLKHLRYLALADYSLSALRGNIGKMKLLQFMDLMRCKKLENLPDSIVKLGQLRYLNLPDGISMIPRGFHGLTNMRILGGFPAHMDGDWCSLDELEPLTQLRLLRLVRLENVSTELSAANAMLSKKTHIINLFMSCTSRLGYDEEGVTEEEQRRTERVFSSLCPPTSVEYLYISGYFGQLHPSWMLPTSMALFNNLKSLLFFDLACCIQLPTGLCQLPNLQFLQVSGAPCIRSVGTEFLRPSQPAAASFQRLQEMELKGMVEWEEWEWEEKVQAMPRLEELLLENCKLGRVPPGLARNARALRKLSIQQVKQISCLENFPYVVELTMIDCPDLESITNLPKLQKLHITRCPKLKLVKDVPALQRLVLEDRRMETVPGYLRELEPSYLELGCSLTLLTSIAAGESGPEFAKVSHIEHVKAKRISRLVGIADLHVLYTRKPYSFYTNANPSFLSRGTLSVFEDTKMLESALKMPRRAFDYVCSLVKEKSLRDMKEFTFLDGRPMHLKDRVAVALIVLNSADPPATIGSSSSVGVNESTLLQVTESFVHAMGGPSWPGTNKMEKIKSKFDKIYGLSNCCGVVHTTCIPIVSQNSDHEKNEDVLTQVVVDSDMRFTNVEIDWSGNKNQLSTLQDSNLFLKCKIGVWLNGSKLKVLSDGSEEVGEYLIGDAGYPLLPWLLIPYEEENALSQSETEFNKRHSEATAIAPKALSRWKDTWKWLQGGTWRPEDQFELRRAVSVRCRLHNIVIEMEKEGEEKELPIMPRNQGKRQLADEDAARTRDILSQHLLTSMSSQSGVDPVDQKEQPEIVGSSSSGEKVEEEKRC